MSRSDTTILAELRPWLSILGRRRRRLWLGAGLMRMTVAAAIGLLALSGWFITATAVTGALLAAGAAASLEGYVPGEQPRDDGWVKLNTNENPYPPSPRVAEAIAAAVGAMRLAAAKLPIRTAFATRFGEAAP